MFTGFRSLKVDGSSNNWKTRKEKKEDILWLDLLSVLLGYLKPWIPGAVDSVQFKRRVNQLLCLLLEFATQVKLTGCSRLWICYFRNTGKLAFSLSKEVTYWSGLVQLLLGPANSLRPWYNSVRILKRLCSNPVCEGGWSDFRSSSKFLSVVSKRGWQRGGKVRSGCPSFVSEQL